MRDTIQEQHKNAFLWMPIILALGGALYFSCDIEPGFRFPIIITCLIGAIFFRYKNILIRAIMLFLFGFFYSMAYTHIISTPQINDSFGFVPINGVVRNLDFTSDKTRALIEIPSKQINSGISKQHVNIRVSLNGDTPDIGDTINGNLRYFHANGKYLPDSFDFARWAYFNKISGFGFFNDYEIEHKHNTNIRTYIHNKANSKLTDALVLGYKNIIPESESNVWKTIGVGHIWSISGFHMTLIGGWLFAIFYLLFRLIPKITKRVPAKYPSITCAWFGLLFYLCLSGINTTTIRAFLMTTLIFVAIIMGRSVFSLRNAMLVFMAMFFINPFLVMNPGFQLSFSAVLGLLWFFDGSTYIKRNFINKISHGVYLSFMTAFIAGIFTLPFIIAHFSYIPIYTLIGNLIILPIFSILIMPMILIGTIFAIFGNHNLISITERIYDFALQIAQHIANMPYANIQMPPMSNMVLMLSIFGLLILIFWNRNASKNIFIRNINYILCACFIFCAICIYSIRTKPLFYATPDHALVGFVVDNELLFNKSRNSDNYMAFNTWRKFNGEQSSDKNKKYKCNRGFCVFETPQWKLAYMQHFTSLLNNIENVCMDASVDYIVSVFKISAPKCHGKILQDGLLIYENGNIKKIINQRLWHNQH